MANDSRSLPAHSCRNALIGSTRLARRAGTKLATSAAAINTPTINAKVAGSIERTPGT
jgi:hypothetical protein